jgi:WD40 repeat protein
MDHSFNEQQIAQKLTARNLSGLFELLLGLKGLTLNQRYTLRWLYAVGGQSILHLAEGPGGQMTIIKLAFLPYHRAAYISTEDIRKARRRLERESNLLQCFRSTALPEFYELIYAPNPLHSPERGDEIVSKEPYLVMEFIQGRTLLEIARNTHRAIRPDYDALEWLAWEVAATVTDFSIAISEREDAAYLYSDFNPINLVITGSSDRPVRILDAGSLIPLHPVPAISPPFTWAYVPPEYYEAFDGGKILWPTPGYVMYTLSKMLWEVLTNRQPYPTEDPDLSEPTLKNYSRFLRNLILDLVERRHDSFQHLKQAIESVPVLRQLPNSRLTALLTAPKPAPVERLTPIRAAPVPPIAAPAKAVRLTEIHRVQVDAVQALRYSPHGQHIAIAAQNRVELWDSRTLRQIRHFKSPHSRPVVSLDFDATGRYLASGSSDGTICLWNIIASDAIWQYQHRSIYGQVALSTRDEFLATVTKLEAVAFRPQLAERREYRFEGVTTDFCTCVAMAKQHPFLAVGGLWGIRLWNWEAGLDMGRLLIDDRIGAWQIAFSPDERIIAGLISNLDPYPQYSLVVWDLRSREPLWEVQIPELQITDIRIGAGSRLLSAANLGGHLWIWNLEQKMEYAQLANCGRISTTDFAPDGRKFAIGTFDGEVRTYAFDA